MLINEKDINWQLLNKKTNYLYIIKHIETTRNSNYIVWLQSSEGFTRRITIDSRFNILFSPDSEFLDDPEYKPLIYIQNPFIGFLKENTCNHPPDQIISNSADGNIFKVCRKCKQEI